MSRQRVPGVRSVVVWCVAVPFATPMNKVLCLSPLIHADACLIALRRVRRSCAFISFSVSLPGGICVCAMVVVCA